MGDLGMKMTWYQFDAAVSINSWLRPSHYLFVMYIPASLDPRIVSCKKRHKPFALPRPILLISVFSFITRLCDECNAHPISGGFWSNDDTSRILYNLNQINPFFPPPAKTWIKDKYHPIIPEYHLVFLSLEIMVPDFACGIIRPVSHSSFHFLIQKWSSFFSSQTRCFQLTGFLFNSNHHYIIWSASDSD